MLVTIFIRAHNEAAYISLCLEKVFAQVFDGELDVIVLDSGSSDGTPELASRFPVRLFSVPKRDFSYSGALNFGIDASRGELFVALSAHAIPKDTFWLRELICPLDDSQVAGSFSRQVPWPDVSQYEAEQILHAFPKEDFLIEPAAWRSSIQAGAKPFEVSRFSNASSCMRTSLLRSTPFDDLPFAEDRAWAVRQLLAGRRVAYAARSIVLHSHPPSLPAMRTIAERATIAKAAISAYVYRELGLPIAERPSRLGGLITPILGAGVILMALLVGAASLRKGAREGARTFVFLLCSLGTTLGKQAGQARVEREGPRQLQPARPLAAYSLTGPE